MEPAINCKHEVWGNVTSFYEEMLFITFGLKAWREGVAHPVCRRELL